MNLSSENAKVYSENNNSSRCSFRTRRRIKFTLRYLGLVNDMRFYDSVPHHLATGYLMRTFNKYVKRLNNSPVDLTQSWIINGESAVVSLYLKTTNHVTTRWRHEYYILSKGLNLILWNHLLFRTEFFFPFQIPMHSNLHFTPYPDRTRHHDWFWIHHSQGHEDQLIKHHNPSLLLTKCWATRS